MLIPIKFNNDINTTSNKTATVQAMVLRENKTTRISYIPKIIDKGDDWSNSVSGCFIAQRKGPNESWDDIDGISLSNLKKGEWTKFELHSSDLLNALNYSEELKKMCMQEKSLYKIHNKQILILDENVDKEEIKTLVGMIDNSEYSIDIIKDILKNNDNWKDIIAFLYQDDNKDRFLDAIQSLKSENKNELFNILNLSRINPKIIKENLSNSQEEFWQKLFNDNPQFIYCIIPSMMQIIGSKAFVGGKNINNKGGSIADFIFNSNIKNVSIIEIKTPTTPLLGSQYRDNVYCPSKDLTAAIIQVKEQKDTFLKEYNSFRSKYMDENKELYAFDPKCYLIIGSTDGMDAVKIKSLNLYRNELRNVEIITFNELYKKLEIIYKTLGGNSNV